VDLAEDRKAELPNGNVHIRIYRVWSGSALNSMALVMAVVSRPDTAFTTDRPVEVQDRRKVAPGSQATESSIVFRPEISRNIVPGPATMGEIA
jgi:hypothetical protein